MARNAVATVSRRMLLTLWSRQKFFDFIGRVLCKILHIQVIQYVAVGLAGKLPVYPSLDTDDVWVLAAFVSDDIALADGDSAVWHIVDSRIGVLLTRTEPCGVRKIDVAEKPHKPTFAKQQLPRIRGVSHIERKRIAAKVFQIGPDAGFVQDGVGCIGIPEIARIVNHQHATVHRWDLMRQLVQADGGTEAPG